MNREGVSVTSCVAFGERLCCRLWHCRWWSDTAEDPAHQQWMIVFFSQSLYSQNSPYTQGKTDVEVRGLSSLIWSSPRGKRVKIQVLEKEWQSHMYTDNLFRLTSRESNALQWDLHLSLSAQLCGPGTATLKYIPDIRGHTKKVSFHLHGRPV